MKDKSTSAFVFISACLGMLLFGITLITLGSVALEIQEKFNLDAVSAGAIFSILPFGVLAGSLVFGPVADRHGYKVILVLSSLAIFAGLEGLAFAPSLLILKISAFIFGFGGGAINGAANGVVSDISSHNKEANLSILGVFFAIGALGIPSILGLLENQVTYQRVLFYTGCLVFVSSIFFIAVNFPRPKLVEGIPSSRVVQLLKDELLLIIGFFLFCQSGFETLVNNWTTTFLVQAKVLSTGKSLYALSLYVAAMAVMRLVLGGLLRKFSSKIVVLISASVLIVGTLILSFTTSYTASVGGLLLIGAGLAAGFPVMLGLVGARYSDISGTAFSIVISIALTGSILLNYGMGLIAKWYGISYLTWLFFTLTIVMLVLIQVTFKKLKTKTQ